MNPENTEQATSLFLNGEYCPHPKEARFVTAPGRDVFFCNWCGRTHTGIAWAEWERVYARGSA